MRIGRPRTHLLLQFTKAALFSGVAALILCAQLKADTLQAVTDRSTLGANDQVDWSQFGPPDTDVIDGSQISSQTGIGITVTEPQYGFQVQSAASWGGAFQSGDAILCNCNSPFPVTFAFSQAVYGAGLQIDPHSAYSGYDYTIYLAAYNGTTLLGTFSEAGITGLSQAAPFLGVISDTPEITSITYRVGGQIYNSPYGGDIGVNQLSLLRATTAVPEPNSTTLVSVAAISLLFFKGSMRFGYRLRKFLARS